jgi:hypothetical protein
MGWLESSTMSEFRRSVIPPLIDFWRGVLEALLAIENPEWNFNLALQAFDFVLGLYPARVGWAKISSARWALTDMRIFRVISSVVKFHE